MKITRISLYQVDLPLKEGSYSWADQSFTAFDSTVVKIETDQGLAGFGETCPLGPAYLAAYAEGARTGIAMMAKDLIGLDPTRTDVITDQMDHSLKGHPYAKSALDAACWDLRGKALGRPVHDLLGGARQEKVRLFKVVTRQDPGKMAERASEYLEAGFQNLQVKVGEDPNADVERIKILAVLLQLRSRNDTSVKFLNILSVNTGFAPF